MRTVAGLFRTQGEAPQALKALCLTRLDPQRIGMVASPTNAGEMARETEADVPASAAGRYVGLGAILGAAGGLLGAGVLAIPGIRPVVAVGPIAAALGVATATAAAGAGAGAVAGGVFRRSLTGVSRRWKPEGTRGTWPKVTSSSPLRCPTRMPGAPKRSCTRLGPTALAPPAPFSSRPASTTKAALQRFLADGSIGELC
jgi:hypothetical protein